MSKIKFAALLSLLLIVLSSCTKEKVSLLLSFNAHTLYVQNDTAVIRLELDAPAREHYPIKLKMETIGVEMGREFTIDPVSIYENGDVFITFPQGSTVQEFKLIQLSPITELDSAKVRFGIIQTPASITPGEINHLDVLLKHN